MTVVIGIGNRHRGDDAVGLAVLDAVRSTGETGVTLRECQPDASELIDAWSDAGLAVVIDAIRSGTTPGTVHSFDVTQNPLPTDARATSTHALGLGEAIELARNLGELPDRLVVVGVEVSRLDFGDELSAPVGAAVDSATDRVLSIVRASA